MLPTLDSSLCPGPDGRAEHLTGSVRTQLISMRLLLVRFSEEEAEVRILICRNM